MQISFISRGAPSYHRLLVYYTQSLYHCIILSSFISQRHRLCHITHRSFLSCRARYITKLSSISYQTEVVDIMQSFLISRGAPLDHRKLVYITQSVYHCITQSSFVSQRYRICHITQSSFLSHRAHLYDIELVYIT